MGKTAVRVVWVMSALMVAACVGGDDASDESTVVVELINGPPSISSFTPVSGTQQVMVTITGANFTSDATVSFNGTPATQVQHVGGAKVKAVVPQGATTGPITVTTPFGTATSATAFKVKPLVGTFSPTGGLPGTILTITGSGFSGANQVTIAGGGAAFTVVDDATITATVPTGLTAQGKVVVRTPQGMDSSAGVFVPFPMISGFSPSQGLAGSTFTISGGGLDSVTSVLIGSRALSFVHVDDSTLVATVHGLASTGTVKINTPYGARTSGVFTVIKAPKITSFTPGTAPLPETVTILGSNLSGTTSVSIAGFPLTSFTVVSNKITVDLPIDAPSGKFTVVNPAGSFTSAAIFTGYPDLCIGVTCVASDPCHAAGTCEPSTGLCSDPPVADGTACTDGDACTQTDTCQAGTCAGSNPVVCADPAPCHDPGVCDPSDGTCGYATQPDGTSCSADACTIAGTCSSGTCAESVTCDVPITDGLVANWNAEQNMIDDAGDHDGTSPSISYTSGLDGYAFWLTTSTPYVEVADADDLDFGTGDFSVTFWVLADAFTDGDDGMIHKDSWDGATGNGWLFNVDGAAGGVGFTTRDLDAGVSTSARIDRTQLALGTWYHFAGIRQGNVVSFYVDGALRASATEASPTDVSNGIELRIGSLSPASPQYFNGFIDDVRIYNRALAPDELDAVHTCLPGYCVPNSSCQDIVDAGNSTGDGVYWVNLPGYPWAQYQVVCDMTTDGGGWTLGVNITHDFGPLNLRNFSPFTYSSPTLDTEYRLTCSDSVYGVNRTMFVTGVNPGDPNAWRASGFVDKTNLVCSQSADFSSPQFGASCFTADNDQHTYWGNPAWDMAWALYNVSPAYTLRHCRNLGSGWWNPGRLWYR